MESATPAKTWTNAYVESGYLQASEAEVFEDQVASKFVDQSVGGSTCLSNHQQTESSIHTK